MEEKKKVFIKGCKGHGSEIVKILTELGAKPSKGSCDKDNCVYFIDHDNEISCAPLYFEVARLVMDNYKEIELPRQQWKDGDVLVNSSYPGYYAVFKKYNDNVSFEAYFVLGDKSVLFDTTAYVEGFHLASEEEIKNLPLLFCFLMGALNVAGLCLPKNVAQNPLPDNETKRTEEGDD